MDHKEIGYNGVAWILVVLYMAQRFRAYKYSNEFLNFIAFENIFRPGEQLLNFQKQESLLNERRVAPVIF
jgi:hypothetical protein